MPPPRFTSYQYAMTNQSYVFDRLLYRRVRIDGLGVITASLARAHETDWRRRCQRWIEAEHGDGHP